MRSYTPFLLGLFMLACWTHGYAQEQIGLRIENYAGVNSLLLNPAANLSGKFKWDVNIVAGGLFAENSYAFIGNTNLREILRNTDNIRAVSEFEGEAQIPTDVLLLDYFDDNQPMFAEVSTLITGPSFMVNLESGHSFGLFFNFRSMVSVPRIPSELRYYNIENTVTFEQIDIPAFKGAGMVWSEIGLNYAREMLTDNGTAGFGINLKFLNGYEGFYFNNNTRIQFSQLPDDIVNFSGANLEFGLTRSNSEGEDVSLQRTGRGVGIDLGFNYTIDLDDENYLWRFGVSILDLGRIRFNESAEDYLINTNSLITLDADDYEDVDDLQEAINEFSENTLNDPDAALRDGEFDIWLPGAISLQADYALVPYVYLNGLLVQRVPFGNVSLSRGNLLAFTPRFEHRWFSAALPISLYNYSDMRVGAAVRLAFFTIGSENLGSIIGNDNFTGTDLYFALRINPFSLGFGNWGGWGTRRGKNVKCYEF